MKKQLLYVSAIMALTTATILTTVVICFALINKPLYQAEPVTALSEIKYN